MLMLENRGLNMSTMLPYRAQMEMIRKQYGDCTFAEFERKANITAYSYEEVGYGYRLKESHPGDMAEAEADLCSTPALDEIEMEADALAGE